MAHISPRNDRVCSFMGVIVGVVTQRKDGAYQLIYMSPETLLTGLDWTEILQSPLFQHSLEALKILFLVSRP